MTAYEARSGARFFAPSRARLDEKVSHLEFILRSIDFGKLIRTEVYRVAVFLGHLIAGLSLQAIRAIERLLTRIVRHLHTHHRVDTVPRESAGAFVKTLSDFKGSLKEHPVAPDAEQKP